MSQLQVLGWSWGLVQGGISNRIAPSTPGVLGLEARDLDLDLGAEVSYHLTRLGRAISHLRRSTPRRVQSQEYRVDTRIT